MESRRKTTVLPLVLFCVLLTLVVLKVGSFFRTVPLQPLQTNDQIYAPTENKDENFDPNSIRLIAQLAPPPSNPLAAARPAPAICADPVEEEEEETGPLEFCQQQSLDVTQYITPRCSGNCGNVTSTSVTLTDSYIGQVQNSVDFLGNPGLTGFSGNDFVIKQNSNEIHFLYSNKGGFIGLMQDTIWGGAGSTPDGMFYCSGTNDQAFYRVYNEDDSWGNKGYPVNMECGKENVSTGYLKAFKKKGAGYDINAGDPFISESSLEACSVDGQFNVNNPRQYMVTNSNKMIFQGAAKCNGVDFNMVAMLNTGGAGAEEVNMYCEGKGLCAFYQKLDFSKEENQPKNWVGKDLCNLKASGTNSSIPDYFEYNIQRMCGETPVKVLNNFLDEYSVSCMPESRYLMDYVLESRCERVGKCADWNSTGELKFTADGKLFGLFRNEKAVNERLSNNQDIKPKDRKESIEAYLTAKPEEVPASIQRSGVEFTGANLPDLGLLSTLQSPLYKLSTLDQQCRLVYDKLAAVEELCRPINRIEGEENAECAINQMVPNTDMRYLDLFREMGSADNCFQLMHPGKENRAANTLRDRILSVDPAMEVAYRPAFILVSTKVGASKTANPRFLTQGTEAEQEESFYQVDYLELKVPAFGSDFLDRRVTKSVSGVKNDGSPGHAGDTYRDPLRFTADIFMTDEQQKKYAKEEEDDRNAIREVAQSYISQNLIGSYGDVIGPVKMQIKCRDPQSDNPGQETPIYTAQACDNIARALITFVNSSIDVPTEGQGVDGSSLLRQYSPPRKWLPSSGCFVKEESLYGNSVLTEDPVAEKYRVAEQATTIGSDLGTEETVGRYTKKKEAYAETQAEVTAMDQGPGTNLGVTQVFYISPHNYTLLYAQNAFMSWLTPEQKEIFLKNENFNSVMKTTGIDTFTSEPETHTYKTLRGSGPDGPDCTEDPDFPDRCETHTVSAGMRRSESSPLMWQVAGNIANLPTRLLTFVTSKLDSKVYRFTLGCTGPNATENWLKELCKTVDIDKETGAVIPEASPSPDDTCIEVRMSKEQQQAAAAQIKANLPSQQLRVNEPDFKFAGWAAYFGVPGRPDDQHLFRNDCLGQSCINYIVDRIVTETDLNPYLAIAISLNETGGLISAQPNFIGPHFGCGVDPNRAGYISDGTIEDKFECMVRFFSNNRGLTDDEAMRRYGYRNGVRNDNLNKIIGIVSKYEYEGKCQ